MVGSLISGILAAFVLLVGSAGAEIEGVSLSIVSPPDGAVFETSSVPIATRFVRGPVGDHIHVYVDGVFFKTTKRDTLTLWDLRDGEHTIELRAASREKDDKGLEHKELGVNASVKVTVTAKEARRAPASQSAVK
jgi:hypothetical protein